MTFKGSLGLKGTVMDEAKLQTYVNLIEQAIAVISMVWSLFMLSLRQTN